MVIRASVWSWTARLNPEYGSIATPHLLDPLDRVTEAHQPVRHHLAGAALHQIDQSAGVQVDEPSSELLRAAEAGLVQPQPGRRHTRRQPILDPLTGVSPHRPPIDAQLGGHLERRTGPHPLPRQVPQPLRRAGPRPDLLGGRGERPLRTPRLPAPVAALPPPHHHPPPERRRILHPHGEGRCFSDPENVPQPGHGASDRTSSTSMWSSPSTSEASRTRKPRRPTSTSVTSPRTWGSFRLDCSTQSESQDPGCRPRTPVPAQVRRASIPALTTVADHQLTLLACSDALLARPSGTSDLVVRVGESPRCSG